MKSSAYTGFNSEMLPRCKELRKSMTKQERRLWYEFLRDYPIKIYKQRSIDRFIVDFYCSRAHIAIEVDGGQHYSPDGMQYDSERSAVLARYGVTVIRITNEDVDNRFTTVCEQLDKMIKAALNNEPLE